MTESPADNTSDADDIDPALVEAMRARVVRRKPQDYGNRKAGPGRPRGHPKTGGKKAGTPNLMSPEFRDWLMERAKPFELLASICAGETIEDKEGKRKPTMQERMRAAETLSRKLLPDLAATTLTGKDGGPLQLDNRAGLQDEMKEAARVIAFAYRKWIEENPEEAAALTTPSRPTPRLINPSKPTLMVALPAARDVPQHATALEEPTLTQIGHSESIGRCVIELVERLPDGRERWSIRNPDGQTVGAAFGKAAAEGKAIALSEAYE